MNKDVMLKDNITVLAQAVVRGPDGKKIRPGKFYEYEDGPYVRIMIKSGTVTLVDPPSLDVEFLEKAGYELRDGYTYPVKEVPEEVVAPEPEAPKVMETKKPEPQVPKKTEKVSAEKEPVAPVSKEKETAPTKSDHEPQNLQLTPPIGMGVKKSEE